MPGKVAEQRNCQDAAHGSEALGGAVGGALGALIGGNIGNQTTAFAGAALGSVAGVLVTLKPPPALSEQAERPADYLQLHLGGTLTAYLSGAGDLALVEGWVSGAMEPEAVQVERLRLAFEAARYLVQAYGDTTAQAWFMGSNRLLDWESPAWALRHGNTPEDWQNVIPAARQVVEIAR